jgi:hypothetical protein
VSATPGTIVKYVAATVLYCRANAAYRTSWSSGAQMVEAREPPNHIHFEGENREHQAKELVQDWIEELREKWPQDRFRIYWCEDESEITVRFHRVREGMPNWYDSGLPHVRVIDVAA